MADQFSDAFKRYWTIIATVGALCLYISTTLYLIAADYNRTIGDLKVDIALCRAANETTMREIGRIWSRLEPGANQ